jgi:hypothetical protein
MQRFSSKNLSKYAQPIMTEITKHYGSDAIVEVFEDLCHDGYDNFGPESDLWDLYLVIKLTSGKYLHRRYHAENWYRNNEPCIYQMECQCLSETTTQQLTCL